MKTSIYPFGRDKPPFFFETDDKTYRKFKIKCVTKNIHMKDKLYELAMSYTEEVGIEVNDPYLAYKKACEATQSAMITHARTMMEAFIKGKK